MLSWFRSFTEIAFVTDELQAVGDSIVLTIRQRGIGKESGAPVEMRFYEVWTFRGPKVIRREQFGSKADALEALGLSA
jgi:hypothetical protein